MRTDDRITATWRGREVHQPILRALTIAVGFTLFFLAFCLIVLLTPLWMPLDLLLRWRGRRGFLIFHEGRTFSIELSPAGFRHTPASDAKDSS